MGNLPFIPFVHNSQDVIFMFYLLARVSGLFLISPLLSSQNTPALVRVGIVLLVTLLMGMTLYPDYRGVDATFQLKELMLDTPFSLLQITLVMLKELGIGYLIGYSFTLIFEAVLVGGQVTGVLMGFSLMDIIDPLTQSSRPMISQFFVLFLTLLILSMDLHFVFFRELSNSFRVLPIGNYILPYELLDQISMGTGRLFTWAIQYVAIPYVVLFLVTIGLGFMAKVLPEMNVFMIAFPIKILVGYYCLIIAVGYFPRVLQRTFVECEHLVGRILYMLAGS